MKKTILLIVAILAVAGGTAYYFYHKNHKTSSSVATTSTATTSTASTDSSTASTANSSKTEQPYSTKVKPASDCITHTEKLILYCDSGFSDYLNVIVGEVVTVKNSSSKVLNFQTYASAPENSQTYKVNPNMNLGNIQPGQSKTFVAKPLGEYKYRDNNIPTHTGILGIEDDL